ncbi:succinyl-CoA:acetate CoA-transferase [Dethiosulfatibacter aminovorans DSM 17477]|uniref:Succinyl-CoA:acetate CoA-transferase n=1 Tax=Dethiosulfatibacter aminovorans DSM 17477 TaxID=1121476 RepID=A0A1M6CB34_9FIRM|nr:acetyl-CoA hydrolase/transferase family protein [Dethiosulfatibacter aminovorans]SHI58206.1 succinyl-CoA:acetate CoA-transferase [Dethiosulfatibacter aminovorans DSM 17477]
MDKRIRCSELESKIVSAEEAALLVKDGMVVGASGFTPAGYPKAVPLAIAERAENGEKLGITLITGASVGDELDGALARAGVVRKRYPYQTNKSMRDSINAGEIAYADMHLSHVPQWIKYGYFGNIDVAIVEAVAITEDGGIVPSTSIGNSNVLVDMADVVIVEINTSQPESLEGIHDIYSPANPPHRKPIPVLNPEDRIGTTYIPCDPEKIKAIVYSDITDKTRGVTPIDEDSKKVSKFIIDFLKDEIKAGRMPEKLLPLQSGVGSVANAILGGLCESDFENLNIYSEVLQDSVLDLIDCGKVDVASATSLTISPERLDDFYENFDKYRDKIILRPQEISNNPEVIRRLGVIAMNTAIEFDIYGNVNSTNVNGVRMMNGIGGSGDFARNAYLTIFITMSTAKNGTLSSVVPFVKHVDHTEHDVHVVVTEQGIADLRGLSPKEKAITIIENCVHPDFKEELMEYYENSLKESSHLHTPHDLSKVFAKKEAAKAD